MSTTGSYDIEIEYTPIGGSATVLPLMLAPVRDNNGNVVGGAPRSIADMLTAESAEAPLAAALTTKVIESWHRGVGMDYDQAPGVYTRSEGFACPAGKATGVTIISFAQATTGQINGFAEFLSSLYIAQQGTSGSSGGRVLKITGGTGTAAVSLAGPTGGGAYADGPAATELVRSLIVADNGSAATRLYASSETTGLTGGRLHSTADGTTWTSTTAAGAEWGAGRGLGQMVAVDWTTEDGITDRRIVAVTGARTIAYTLPGSNPQGTLGVAGSMTAAWSDDIDLKCEGTIVKLVAFRRHVFVVTTDNVYDVDELGQSTALTSFLPGMQGYPSGTTRGAIGMGGYIYVGVGSGMMRVYVGNPGMLQEDAVDAWCTPGWRTASRAPASGPVTAMAVDQGYLVSAVCQPKINKTSIYWSIPREIPKIDAPQPLVHYGPEVTFALAYQVTSMHVSNLAGADDLRLWIGALNVGGAAVLYWVSLPIAGSPIQEIAAASAHRFTTNASGGICQPDSYLESLLDTDENKSTIKIDYQWGIGFEGTLTAAAKRLKLETRADPALGSTTYTTSDDIPASGALSNTTKTVTPSTTVSGGKAQYKVSFYAPDASAPPILDSVRRLYVSRPPSLRTLNLHVQYGFGVTNNASSENAERSPEQITAQLLELVGPTVGRAVLRDRFDKRYSVVFRQMLEGSEDWFDQGRVVSKTLVAQILEELA